MAAPDTCAKVATSLLADFCAKGNEAGMLDTMWLVHYDDIDRTLSTKTGQTLSALILKSGKVGYKLKGKDYTNELAAEFVPGIISDRWKHSVPFKILEDSATADEWLQALVNSKMVAVLQKYTTVGNELQGFLVAGFDRGLKVITAAANFADNDTKGAYDVKLESHEKALETRPPLRYVTASPEATLAALEALVTPVIP